MTMTTYASRVGICVDQCSVSVSVTLEVYALC